MNSISHSTAPAETVFPGARQHSYSASSSSPPQPSPLTADELNEIKSTYLNVTLNDVDDDDPEFDDDDLPEDGSLIESNSTITSTPQFAPDDSQNFTAGVGARVGADVPNVKSGTFSANSNAAGSLVRTVRHFSHLQRTSQSELNRHSDLLTMHQRNCLSFVREKVRCWPDRFRTPGQYLMQSSLLLLAHGWTSADRYCRCCIPNRRNPGGDCRLHRFCPYCSWRAGQRAALTYVPAFARGRWHSITGSFTGNVVVSSMADMHSWIVYWDAYHSAFARMVNEQDVRGVFWTEELAVIRFLPPVSLPHVHAVVDADDWTDEHSQKLSNLVTMYLGAHLDSALIPNVQAQSVDSPQSLFHCLHYLFKPLDLVRAYNQSWSERGCCQLATGDALATQINSQASDAVLGYAHITTDRPKMHAVGTLSYRRGNLFIGVPRKDHAQHHDQLKTLGQQKPEYAPDQPQEPTP